MGDIRILKKFNALLHDVTLLNFVLVASLTKRYKSVTLVACAVAVLSVLYLNFSQTTIYSKKVYFRFSSQADLTDTTGRKLTDIVSEVADSFNSQNEVNVLVTNYKFVRKMAEKLVDSPAFASCQCSQKWCGCFL